MDEEMNAYTKFLINAIASVLAILFAVVLPISLVVYTYTRYQPETAMPFIIILFGYYAFIIGVMHLGSLYVENLPADPSDPRIHPLMPKPVHKTDETHKQ